MYLLLCSREPVQVNSNTPPASYTPPAQQQSLQVSCLRDAEKVKANGTSKILGIWFINILIVVFDVVKAKFKVIVYCFVFTLYGALDAKLVNCNVK